MKRINYLFSLVLITLLVGCNNSNSNSNSKYYDTSEELRNSCALEPEENWIYGLWQCSDDNSQLLFTPDGMKSSDAHKKLWLEYFGIKAPLDIRDTELFDYGLGFDEGGYTIIGGLTRLTYDPDRKTINDDYEDKEYKKKNNDTKYRNAKISIGEQFEGFWAYNDEYGFMGQNNQLKLIKYIRVSNGIMTIYDKRKKVIGKAPISTFEGEDKEDGLMDYAMGLFYIEDEWLGRTFNYAVAICKKSHNDTTIFLRENVMNIARFDKIDDISDTPKNSTQQDEYLTDRIIQKGTYELYTKDIDATIYITTGQEIYSYYFHTYSFKEGGKGTQTLAQNTLAGREILSRYAISWYVKNGELYVKDKSLNDEFGTDIFTIIDDGKKIENGGDVYE